MACEPANHLQKEFKEINKIVIKLEMSSAERGICLIATSIMKELFQ